MTSLNACAFVNDWNAAKVDLMGDASRRLSQLIGIRDNALHRGQIAALRRGGSVFEDTQNFSAAAVLAGPDRTDSRSQIDPWHWSNTLTSDLWNMPPSQPRQLRHQMFAVLLAVVLAVLLGHVRL